MSKSRYYVETTNWSGIIYALYCFAQIILSIVVLVVLYPKNEILATLFALLVIVNSLFLISRMNSMEAYKKKYIEVEKE